LNELEKDGAVLRFEFTFELAWKTLHDYLAQESGYADVKGSRVIIKQAIQDGLLVDGHTWSQMLTDRNELTPSYDKEKSRSVLTSITCYGCFDSIRLAGRCGCTDRGRKVPTDPVPTLV
jgi:nucleotidyltransferase substrate binding protein (TIGR01987 family)